MAITFGLIVVCFAFVGALAARRLFPKSREGRQLVFGAISFLGIVVAALSAMEMVKGF